MPAARCGRLLPVAADLTRRRRGNGVLEPGRQTSKRSYEHFELHRLECLRSDERNLMTG